MMKGLKIRITGAQAIRLHLCIQRGSGLHILQHPQRIAVPGGDIQIRCDRAVIKLIKHTHIIMRNRTARAELLQNINLLSIKLPDHFC